MTKFPNIRSCAIAVCRNASDPASRGRTGFSLIEMSMVLAVIGLVIGGVVLGQDLIHAATISRQIGQIQEYKTAFNTFLLKYNCLPGDCSDATQILGSADPFGNAINNGNGNGIIDTQNGTYYNDAGETYAGSIEMWGAIQQLSVAKLIPYTPKTPSIGSIGNGFPTLIINPGTSFIFGANYNFTDPGRNPDISSYQTGSNLLWLAMCNIPSGTWDSDCAIFTAAELQAIDRKIDDGMPLYGQIFGFGGLYSHNDCLNIVGRASTYKLTNATAQCQAAVVLD
ncbi:MAG TPA: prepilin-type N-terminal cleavage/methylation domain-containing protein [Ktedonobacteraceae bacterium]|nr:prepilin-type N-terminal cleavage/methylation domain-containing protein [Ktedonobacteraceae bacterium]